MLFSEERREGPRSEISNGLRALFDVAVLLRQSDRDRPAVVGQKSLSGKPEDESKGK